MYKSRPLDTPTIRTHQPRQIVEIAAENPHIPLKENWGERWCTAPKDLENLMDDILGLEVRPDDVFLVTFMKCGTTWMQEAAWLLMNNLDFETAKKVPMRDRSIFIEFSGLHPLGEGSVDKCKKAKSPRLIKSHLPANLLPKQLWEKKQKTIYVARNWKDVVVSSFHFVNGVHHWHGSDMDDYVRDFLNNEILYEPYLAHTVDFWKMRHEPFIFFVTYEEMQRDLAGVLQRLCTFLERPALTEDELAKAVKHLSFENMKESRSTNITFELRASNLASKDFQFMRRGIVGSYKDELSPENQVKLDAWARAFLAKHGIKEEDIFGEF